jgi:galactose-1-phosphate uridylyltransferase
MTEKIKQADINSLRALLQSKSIDDLSMIEICNYFRNEKSISNYKPDSIFQIDPRNGELIVYNSSRATRPHTNSPQADSSDTGNSFCPICEGNTTGIMDIAELSEGFTFINKNMFPIFFPFEEDSENSLESLSFGLHFLQWTSSIHSIDWHNIQLKDARIVFARLAALEKKLLLDSSNFMPASESELENISTYGYVSIIKNYGKIAGGSLSHGHQQIVTSNIMPKQIYNNWNYYMRTKQNFTEFLLNENPEELIVKDYGPILLIVPFFMRRPFDMFLIVKDTSKKFLHDLNEEEQAAVCLAWQEATRVMLQVLKNLNKEEAYNVTINNGPGAGLYFEFLPFSQLIGGYEKIGLWVCQESPNTAAEILRNFISNLKPLY